jgi:hypothetical protein
MSNNKKMFQSNISSPGWSSLVVARRSLLVVRSRGSRLRCPSPPARSSPPRTVLSASELSVPLVSSLTGIAFSPGALRPVKP